MVTTVKSLVHSNSDNSQMVTPLKTATELPTALSTHNNDRASNSLVHSQQQTPVFEIGGREGGGGRGVGGWSGGGGGRGPPLPLAPASSQYFNGDNSQIGTIVKSLQQSNRCNTSTGTEPKSLQHFNRSVIAIIDHV